MSKALSLLLLGCVGLTATKARAQYVPAQLPLAQLPQRHPYQRDLRDFLTTLAEKDLAVERKEFSAVVPANEEEQFRHWLLTLNLARIQAAALPASAFTLRAIEGGKGLTMPAAPADSQMLAWLANWDYPGNPYHGSRALKLRALVLAITDLVMLDELYETNPQGSDRADFLGGNLIWIGYTCKCARDVLPAKARTALDAGLKKHAERLNKWGPRGAMTDMDLFAPVGLWYVSEAMGDPAIKRLAETYSKRLFTEERFFHPSGYFVDVGCFDTSYNGISLYFATWAALASDWQFAREAVTKAYRLRAHLCLPDPDGQQFGPSHMSSRTSADPPRDQWNFPHRPHAAALATDEALHLAPLPSAAEMRNAPARIATLLNQQMTPVHEVKPQPWRESHWSGALNFAYDHYKKGYFARRQKLEKESSPLVKPLYLRKETFVREFDRAFVIARFPEYAAVLHTGPVRGWPHGFGGGQLSAFWTPASGTALLGRRRGMQGPVPDSLDEWRTWPIHAVSGVTADSEFLTSAAVKQPAVKNALNPASFSTVSLEGTIPAKEAKNSLGYKRVFILHGGGLKVQSSLRCPAALKFSELRETLPVFLHEAGQVKTANVKVSFQVDGKWLAAEARPQSSVKAIRVDRLGGAVLIVFDRPRTVELSPRAWTDGFQTQATCRTLLVDLLDGQSPKAPGAVRIDYTIAPGNP